MLDLSEFFTCEDLEKLTGYKHYTKQVNWLKNVGIPYFTNRYGQPVVWKKHVYPDTNSSSPIKRIEPDAKALKESLGLTH